RAKDKYHSGGLWANSCCSHPRLGESLEEACLRRLPDETGIAVEECLSSSDSNEAAEGLAEKGALLYRAEFDNGLTEHEYDHVFVGWLKDPESGFTRNPEEADEMKFVDMNWLMKDVLLNSYKYSAWFMPALMIATDGTEFESQNKAASDRIIY
ncbi:MAG: NUDIX domain-containing protein, partial [Bacillota bacterium]|nr:NUDIX domain-containing protein [Bacillota bacterium]